jgi:hypothetical protein
MISKENSEPERFAASPTGELWKLKVSEHEGFAASPTGELYKT